MKMNDRFRRGKAPLGYLVAAFLVIATGATLSAWAANASRYPSWSGTAGDYTDPAMWYNGIAADVAGDCANLSRTAAGEATAYIREGMTITNGWINCGRTNDFNIVMSGGYVLLKQDENVNDAALKLARGEDVSGGDPIRPTGTLTMSGGLIVATNGCVSVGERGNGVLTMTGGELWAWGRLSIARLAGSTGTMTVSGGAKVTAYSFYLPYPSATLIVDGGTLARTRFNNSLPNAASFIWGDVGATMQIGANGATFVLSRDASATIPISSLPGTAGTLEKRGAGTLRFSDTATNTYAGATIVSEGAIMAEAPHNLPGYDEPGRVTVRSGASLLFGKGWSAAEKAAALANVTMEAGATVKAAFDISDEDMTIPDDLSYTGGMEKYGAKMLTLTGHNTFGGEQKIYEGTLRADFGQGLDSNYCVTLCGGTLSSVSGRIVSSIGSGPGQVNIVSGSTPAFSARGVPLTVNLLNGASSQFADNRINVVNSIPSYTLMLNGVDADQPITFANNLNIQGTTANAPFSLYVNSGVATLSGSIMDATYKNTVQTTFKKYGPGTLRLTNSGFRDRCFRFNVEEGDVVFDHPASVANGASGSGYFYYINKNGTGTLYATNQTITTENNFNVLAGTALIKGGKLNVGYNLNANGGTTVLDGGTVTVTQGLLPGNVADSSGVVILTNGVRVTTLNGDFAAGSNNNNSYGRIEIFDGCCVTGNVVGAGSGDIIQWGGEVYGKYSGVDNSVRLGRYASRRGFYYMAGGEFGCGGAMSVGRTGKAHGELWQTGGTVKPNTDVIIGDTEGATGVVHVVGGEMRPNSGCVLVGKNGIGELVVRGEGVVKTGTALSLGHESATARGRVMLCKGGTIEAAQVVGHGTTADGRYAEFIFDGGTLRATSDSATYVSNLTSFAVGSGGGKVDTDGHDVTFAQPLAATELNSDLAHRWSFNGDYVDSVTGETAPDNKGGTFFNQGSGKAVQLAGGNKGTSYISLGPKKLPVDGSEATIEFWARVDVHRNWQRAFDIGKDANAFFTLTFRREGVNTDYCGVKYKGLQTGVYDTLVTYDVSKKPWGHICIVCKRGADGRWKVRGYRKYRDGTDIIKRFEYDAPEGWSLANQDQTYTYIGRSLQNNYDTSAAFDEFRIWKRALTDEEIEANGDLGPDVLPSAVFEKRGAGTLTFTGVNTYAQPTVVSGGTLALAAGASLPADNAITVGDGATLDLGGNAAAAASITGAGTLANGTLALTGTADISAMSYRLDAGVLPMSASMEVLEAAGGVTGQFASVSLPRGWRLSYSGSTVKAVKSGMVIIIQ